MFAMYNNHNPDSESYFECYTLSVTQNVNLIKSQTRKCEVV